MNLSDEIRKQIEKNKELKLAVGEINNHLSVLEGLTRKDIMEQVDEAYQKGYVKGYADKTNNDEVCKQIAKDIQDKAYQRGYKACMQENDFDSPCTSCEAYQRGLHEGNDIGYKDGVKDGRNEAWEAAKKLFSTMAESDIEKAFPTEWNNGGFKALMNLQPQEAIERLKAYEDDKIKRGDIVNVKGSCNDDLLGVVTKVWEDNCYIMWGDGSGGAWSKDSVVKTGKHIDVDKFFEEIAT